jgi:lysophospholipase L1-like esterase
MLFTEGQKVLFIGDSITDCGRGMPVGQYNTLGEGYVALINSMIMACYPERSIWVLNAGISGNRVTDLEARWQVDVLDRRPDWLSVMIGINDVWRQFDRALDSAELVPIEKYKSLYRNILQEARPNLKGLILMSPFYIEQNPMDPMRERMDHYRQVVAQLASEFDAVYVDVQKAFDRYLIHRPTQSLCADRVHPNKAGHTIIANAFLSMVGFDWNRANSSSHLGA